MADEIPVEPPTGVTRRTVLATGAGTAAASMLPLAPPADAQQLNVSVETGNTIRISASVNGQPVVLEIDSRASLLDLLRERLELTGTKKGCDHGQCGACTVHLDGRPVSSCLTLAAKIDGRQVTTIEGLAEGGDLHPMQQALRRRAELSIRARVGRCRNGRGHGRERWQSRARR